MAQFRSFWHGGPLTPFEVMCLSSFVMNGHSFDLFTYAEIAVPAGIVLRDANEIVPEAEYFTYGPNAGLGAGSPAAFSNRFRYELLVRYGEWWVDTDVLCLRPDLPAGEVVFAYQDEALINSAILRLPPAHPVAVELLSEAKRLGRDIRWGDTGPNLITRILKDQGLRDLAAPSSTFYPIYYTDALSVLDPNKTDDVFEKISDSHFIHLWNEIFRRSAILKDVAPPFGSFIDKKCVELGIEFPSGLQYSHYEIERILEKKPPFAAERLQLLGQRDELMRHCDDLTREREAQALQLTALAEEREAQALQLAELTAEREAQALQLTALAEEREAQALQLAELTAEREALAQERDDLIDTHNAGRAHIAALLNSTSWKATAPLRILRGKLYRRL